MKKPGPEGSPLALLKAGMAFLLWDGQSPQTIRAFRGCGWVGALLRRPGEFIPVKY